MSAVESALDVLSRAATMMQEGHQESCRRSPWRRRDLEHRNDPYSRKALDMSTHQARRNRLSVIVPNIPQPGTTIKNTPEAPAPTATPSSGGQKTGIRIAGGVSDPAIDEHFKRSLGLEEYAAVFNATTTDKETGLSVDDHFAKALGETWKMLQATNLSTDST